MKEIIDLCHNFNFDIFLSFKKVIFINYLVNTSISYPVGHVQLSRREKGPFCH